MESITHQRVFNELARFSAFVGIKNNKQEVFDLFLKFPEEAIYNLEYLLYYVNKKDLSINLIPDMSITVLNKCIKIHSEYPYKIWGYQNLSISYKYDTHIFMTYCGLIATYKNIGNKEFNAFMYPDKFRWINKDKYDIYGFRHIKFIDRYSYKINKLDKDYLDNLKQAKQIKALSGEMPPPFDMWFSDDILSKRIASY